MFIPVFDEHCSLVSLLLQPLPSSLLQLNTLVKMAETSKRARKPTKKVMTNALVKPAKECNSKLMIKIDNLD